MVPVLQMIEHCRMNCGADSRKVSRHLEPNTSFLMICRVLTLDERAVSRKKMAKNALKFLESVLQK
jgi:hypothetical protein